MMPELAAHATRFLAWTYPAPLLGLPPMRIIRSWQAAEAAEAFRGGAVTVGNFDGVHMGHRQVLAELRGHAEAVHGPAVAVTFEPHPRAVLYPDEAPRRLCHLHERLERLAEAGMDAVLLLHFNKDIAGWPAERFIQTLHDAFKFRHIHVGYDFAFGHDRQGHADLIRELGQRLAFTVSEATAFQMQGAVVSSTRIRSAIEGIADALGGRAPSEEAYAAAGAIAAERCSPSADLRGSVEYKRHLADELTRRALRRAVGRIQGEGA